MSDLLYDKTINADNTYLNINNNVPYLGYIYNNEEYMCFYYKFLKDYYPKLMDIKKDSVVNFNNKLLLNTIERYNHTYSFWINISTSNYNNLTNYFVSKNYSLISTKDLYNYMSNINDVQIIFTRGDANSMWPCIYFNKNFDMYARFSNTQNNYKDIRLCNIPINFWHNITIVMSNNVISVYLNGKLEITSNIGLSNAERNINITNKPIYLFNNDIINDDSNNTSFGFPGYLNYFNYYNRSLEPQIVNNLYNNYLPKITNFNNNLKSYLNKNNTDIYKDIIKNRNSL